MQRHDHHTELRGNEQDQQPGDELHSDKKQSCPDGAQTKHSCQGKEREDGAGGGCGKWRNGAMMRGKDGGRVTRPLLRLADKNKKKVVVVEPRREETGNERKDEKQRHMRGEGRG